MTLPDIVVNLELRQTDRALFAVLVGFAGTAQLFVLVGQSVNLDCFLRKETDFNQRESSRRKQQTSHLSGTAIGALFDHSDEAIQSSQQVEWLVCCTLAELREENNCNFVAGSLRKQSINYRPDLSHKQIRFTHPN